MGQKPDTCGPPPRTVAVLGGGLAGLSAARALVERGFGVTLVEKRPFLGGRAFSFHDREANVQVDNGQHVFMGCCTYYIDFLKALGVSDKTYLQGTLRTEIVREGKLGALYSTPWLGPLHLLPSFLMYPHLTLKDKLLAIYGLLRVKLTDRAKQADALDRETLYNWLRRHHQSDRAIDYLWNLIVLPTLNDDVRDVGADMGLMIFQEGLLKQPADATMGFSRVGLTELTGEPAGRFLEEKGAKVICGKSAEAFEFEDGIVEHVRLSDGSLLRADAYVAALPFDTVLSLLPTEFAEDSFFAPITGLSSSPIVGVHLWYDRPVMEQEFLAFLDSPVQWVFNKSRIQGADSLGGQYVCISVSGAWDYIGTPKDELRELFSSEMQRLFPKAKAAKIERFLVVKQPQATFRCVPGVARHRPSQATPVANLFLAGEWTATGWPSTMEGAVRSGVFAADALASRA